MENYWKMTVAQLKDFVLNNNINTARPSGKWVGLIKRDYITAIKASFLPKK